ncbi:thiaminase II [Zunongwangia sp.]|uniref:thiaminase II n=1 Tax=Zunongwangia sp. TaxID=1965325 RepID=UPI003AA94E06
MKWSKSTWEAITPIYSKIIEMPFIKELMDGSLPLEKFQFYMGQDSIYLEHFGKALAIIAARCPYSKDTMSFLQFSEGTITVERALHESYFKMYGLTENTEIQPACHHYIHFLKSVASLENIEVAMAAVLPCFWIYKEVGDYIVANQTDKENPYQEWIATYSGEEFGEAVQNAIDICNRYAEKTTPKTREKMTQAFKDASYLEYYFWQAGYNLRSW